MATVLRANLKLIVSIILARLQAVTGLPPERCFATQRVKQPYDAQADQCVFVRVLNYFIEKDIYQGGGRIDARQRRVLKVTVRTRLALDEPGHDTLWLTHASLGHLDLCDLVSDALVGFHVEDADRNILCTHPVEPAEGTMPEKDPPTPEEWGESTLNFQFVRELDLDQTYS